MALNGSPYFRLHTLRICKEWSFFYSIAHLVGNIEEALEWTQLAEENVQPYFKLLFHYSQGLFRMQLVSLEYLITPDTKLQALNKKGFLIK